MGTLLQILGFVALLVILALVALVLGWKVLARKLGGALAQLGKGGLGPTTITLVPSGEPLPEALGQRVGALEKLGMQRIGAFVVPEMAGVTLFALFHPQHNVYGVAYQHPQAGSWSDVYGRYADAGGITVSNAPMGGMLDPMPGWKKLYDKAANEAELMQTFLAQQTPQAQLRPVSATAFAGEFMEAYQMEMEWRTGRGGATMEEIQRVANATPGRFDDATVAAARAVIEADARAKLVDTIRRKVAGTMDGGKWEAMRDRVMILHANMTLDDAREVLQEAAAHETVTEEHLGRFEERLETLCNQKVHVLNLPELLVEVLPEAARYRVLMKMDEPVAALVLVRPQG